MPDVLILDIVLAGGRSGLAVLDQLRDNPHTAGIAVIVCTADAHVLATPAAELRNLGVHCLAKPFDVQELSRLVEDALSRSVDRTRKRVLVGAEPLALTPTEYRLVSTLAEQADEVVTRKDLAWKVWGYEDASSGRTIDVYIRRLRAKLTGTEARAPVIVAVRGLGYRLTSGGGD